MRTAGTSPFRSHRTRWSGLCPGPGQVARGQNPRQTLKQFINPGRHSVGSFTAWGSWLGDRNYCSRVAAGRLRRCRPRPRNQVSARDPEGGGDVFDVVEGERCLVAEPLGDVVLRDADPFGQLQAGHPLPAHVPTYCFDDFPGQSPRQILWLPRHQWCRSWPGRAGGIRFAHRSSPSPVASGA